jgi:hypothetical protein
MSAEELLELTSSAWIAITDPGAVREKIHDEFDASTSSEERGALLAIYKATFDITESHLAKNSPEKLAEFQKARAQDYNLLLVKETTVGLDSPGGGDVSVELLKAVTDREVAAGRMSEDHVLRKLAVDGCAAPHPTHEQLLAKHAKLKEQAERAKAVQTAGSASTAYAVGAVLGRRLSGLFGKK